MKPKIALSDNIIKLMSPADRKREGVLLPAERKEKRDIKVEKELQKLVEDWLHLAGWWRRSPADIRAELPPKGWQIHLHKAQRNPLLLDILLLANDRCYFEFELKLPGGRYSSKEQEILCEHHDKPKFETLEEVIEAVEEWGEQ